VNRVLDTAEVRLRAGDTVVQRAVVASRDARA
jgi:hypothetical protein